MAKFNVLGKYLTIENKGTGMMMSVKEGLTEPRAPVATWKAQKGDNQVWYMDPLTDTIRNRQSHLCLDLDSKSPTLVTGMVHYILIVL